MAESRPGAPQPPLPAAVADAADPAAAGPAARPGAPAADGHARAGVPAPGPAGAAAPDRRLELTPRALLTAAIVAAMIGALYPFVVLKLGYGPNISVVSAFFGFMALSAVGFFTGVRGTRWENNLVQTAGTAAGEAGFMCVVLAAMDMLNQKPELGFSVHLSSLQIFGWLSTAGMLGVLLAVPLRRHFIDEENLTFADGTAAGETLLVLDLDRRQATKRVNALAGGMLLSGVLAALRDLVGPLRAAGRTLHTFTAKIPENVYLGRFGLWDGKAMAVGSEVSLLSFGSGLIVGLRISLSMALGLVLAWVIAPVPLFQRGIIAAATKNDTLKWVMWPATGLMVAGGLTALALKWRLLVRTFRSFGSARSTAHGLADPAAPAPTDFPLRWVAIGVPVFTVALCVVQHYSLHFPIWLTLVSLLLSVLLMLVGIRVLGETNWAPISALANFMQGVFAALSPHNMAVNMIGSGMSGTVAAHGEHLMQDFKAGKIVGSNNRNLTIVQLLAVPIGSAAVALTYPLLVHSYGVPGSDASKLASPISVKWAGFAQLLQAGASALPRGCLTALWVGLALGCVMTVLEPRYRKYVPSPTGVGLGMLISGVSLVPLIAGGIVQAIWQRRNPAQEETYNTPLASGLICGEAIVVLLIIVLRATSTAWGWGLGD